MTVETATSDDAPSAEEASSGAPGGAPTLEEVTEELYATFRDDFVDRRGELVKELRAAGDREGATAVGKLRKPSVAAWLANMLARDHPEEIGALEELGSSLRSAQERLEGDSLRALSRQRHQLVRAMVERGRRIGRDEDVRVGDATIRELERTVTAALADPEAARALAAGRLVTALEPGAGLGDAVASSASPAPAVPRTRARPGRARPRVAPGRSGSASGQPVGAHAQGGTGDDATAEQERAEQERAEREERERLERERAERERLRRASADAREAADRAATAAKSAEEAVTESEQGSRTAAQDVRDLRERLAEAEETERAADERARAAREQRDAAREVADAAVERRDEAQQALAGHDGGVDESG